MTVDRDVRDSVERGWREMEVLDAALVRGEIDEDTCAERPKNELVTRRVF